MGIFTKTVTNVGLPNSTYHASVYMPYSLNATVEPSVLSFSAIGEKKSLTVKVNGPKITQQPIIASSIVWKDGVHEVRMPLVVYTVLSSAFCSYNNIPHCMKKFSRQGSSMYHRNRIPGEHVLTKRYH